MNLILLFSLIRLFIIFGKLDTSAVVAANGVESRHSRTSLMGRDLPDADGPGFVALNGRFGGANRSAGQKRYFVT